MFPFSLIPEPYKLYVKLAGAAVIAALASGLWLYVGRLRHDAASQRARADAAEAKSAVLGAQANVTTAASQAADTASAREVHITVQAEGAARAVQQAQGASDALPPDVLARWRAGVDGVRSQGAPGDPDGAGGGKLAGAVPSTGR